MNERTPPPKQTVGDEIMHDVSISQKNDILRFVKQMFYTTRATRV